MFYGLSFKFEKFRKSPDDFADGIWDNFEKSLIKKSWVIQLKLTLNLIEQFRPHKKIV